MDGKKQLTETQYLQALGLFTLANENMRRAQQCAVALRELLGIEEYSSVEDAVWDYNATRQDFNAALEREDLILPAPPSPTSDR